MEFTIRQKIGLSLGYTILVFAIGRYTKAPAKVSTQVQEQQKEVQIEDKHVQTHTTVTETKRPDGTDVKVTVIDRNTQDERKDQTTTQIQEKQTVTPPETVNISLLGANDFSHGRILPTYGLSTTIHVVGPVTGSVWGLMNGTIGVSAGVDF